MPASGKASTELYFRRLVNSDNKAVSPPPRPTQVRLSELCRRLLGSAVVWSWAYNFLRLASGLLLLPLLFRILSADDLGMYYLFLSLSAVSTALDFGFGPTLGRFVNYAMGGAKRLSAQGVDATELHGQPNYALLWELFHTAKICYRILAGVTFVLLCVFGSLLVGHKAAGTSSPLLTWIAWGVCLLSAVAEVYFSFSNVFLRNLNQMLVGIRIMVFCYALRLVLACGLLLFGAGLLALPVATLLTGLLIGVWSRRECQRLLPAAACPAVVDCRPHLATLWPGAWRLGLYFAGLYLGTNGNVLLCSAVLGLKANASYGPSLQVMSVIGGLATVWTQVKWPLIGQYMGRQQLAPIRQLLPQRLALLLLTYAVLAVVALFLGPPLLKLVAPNKSFLPVLWFGLLALNGLLEQNCSTWNTLISLGNRLPMLWASLATNAACFALNAGLLHLAGAQPGWLVLGPLLTGLAFNYWFWPRYGAHTLGLSWTESLRLGLPRRAAAT